MDRLFSTKSGSSVVSSSSAAQPALNAGASSSSTPQPTLTAVHSPNSGDAGAAEQSVVKLECLQDVRRWLATIEVVRCNVDIRPLREAVAVLSRTPRPRKEEVRPFLSEWSVDRLRQGNEELLRELIQDFQDKVAQAAQKLQEQLANNPVVLATVVPSPVVLATVVPSSGAQFDTSGVTSAEQPVSSSSVQPPAPPVYSCLLQY